MHVYGELLRFVLCGHLPENKLICSSKTKQVPVAQLSQRDRAAGYISFGQKWKTETDRQYFTDIIGLSSTTVT